LIKGVDRDFFQEASNYPAKKATVSRAPARKASEIPKKPALGKKGSQDALTLGGKLKGKKRHR